MITGQNHEKAYSVNLSVSDNFVLRELSVCDADKLFKLVDDNRKHLRTWLGWLDRTNTISDSKGFIEQCNAKWQTKTGLVLGIWLVGELVGSISFNLIDLESYTAHIGYWLADGYQGRGLITDACRVLIEYGFTELNLDVIKISCAEANTKSQAVPKRLGMKVESTEENKEWLYDHYVNHVVFIVTADEWGTK